MKTKKIWIVVAVAVMASIIGILIPQFLKVWENCAKRYFGAMVVEAIEALENDPTAYLKDTQDLVRLIAAATATGHLAVPEAYYILALQYEREGNYVQAEHLYQQTIRNAPSWSWPYVALGILLIRHGKQRLDEAETLLRQGVLLQPDWVRPYNSLGVVLRLQNKLDEAERVALQALHLAPYDVAAHNNYGNLLTVMRRYEEAEAHYKFALELEPENAKLPYNLACLYAQMGLAEKACDFLSEAIRLNSEVRADAALDPSFELIRMQPRFQQIVHNIPTEVMVDEKQSTEE